MKQYEAVIKVMEENGGFATLGFLNQNVMKVEGCAWKTKTPFASIRRIVQDERFFFKIRPGLWALKTFKDRFPPGIVSEKGAPAAKQSEYTHTYYQGLLIEVGNLRGFKTFAARQDRNKSYLGKKLSDVTTIDDMYEFSYQHIVRLAETIDVSWFNDRHMPASLFEVEHSTSITNSLLKFVELQDFDADFCIVADEHRKREFEGRLSLEAFRPVSERVRFWSYEDVAELHSRTGMVADIELKLKPEKQG